jgi:glycosyltransferase involved in cell wall biosynthesis
MDITNVRTVKTVPVSVIIPCWQCADVVERAVASVASQRWKPAEVILADDASKDGTLLKLHDLQNRYGENWIKIIALKRNAGPAAARNAAWDAAKEKYIAFLDADDAWHPCKIEIQYAWMESHPNVVLTGHGFIRKSPLARTEFGKQSPDLKFTENYEVVKITPFRLLFSNRFFTRSVMLHRNLPFRFHPDKRRSEDYLLWLEIVLNGHSAWYIDAPMAYEYKAPFGEGGLTRNLSAMEAQELDTYRRLYRKGLLSAFSTCCLMMFSLVKYVRRAIINLTTNRHKFNHEKHERNESAKERK